MLVARVTLCYITRVSNSKQSKLTLVVDPSIVRRAKSYASEHKTSVSSLVESYLKNLTAENDTVVSSESDTWAPITRSLFGALADVSDVDTDELKYRYLRDKYLHD